MLQSATSLPLLRLVLQGSGRFNFEFAGALVLAGLSNAVLLAIINAAAENARNADANGRFLAMFVIAITLYIVTQRHILFTSIREVEKLLHDIRVRVAERIRTSNLSAIERVGRSDIYGIINRETQQISQAAGTLIVAGQSMLMVVFAVLYLAMLSRAAFIIAAVITWAGLTVHFRRAHELNTLLHEAQTQENRFLDGLTHLLDGFKEARMNRTRAGDLFAHLRGLSGNVEAVKTKSSIGFAAHFIFAQAAFYILLAAIVFLLPKLGEAYSEVVMKLTATVLFIIGPLSAIVSAIPMFSTANVAAAKIFELESVLAHAGDAGENGRPEAEPPATFQRLVLDGVTFQYSGAGNGSAFKLGPLNLSVNAGDIVFIVGGNGAGKSTLMKTLTGLYLPQAGSITLDSTLVTAETATWYRSHFATVFTDYHLFDRLYGLQHVPPERVNALLQMMQIDHKTQFVDGRFTTQNLSGGQRKRLALIVAMLEERPIFVLDEWAADQDPPFRKYFYERVLRELKAQGRTVIAVTHDDKYFGVADQIVKMEYGTFVPYQGA